MNVEKTTMEYLFHVESQAEKILNEKSEIISLDKIRNNNRMAIRALMNCKIPQGKTWMAVGPIMVKVSIEKAKEILQKEQISLNCRINTLRSELRINVNTLRDLEYQEPVKGLFLNPLTKNEMKEMNLEEYM